jgi:hypothetical protein
MTFDPNVPNAGQSPGLFPAQMNTDLARLKAIINTDHVFNDTAQSTDGIHRQMHMVARAMPGGLPTGSNAILYTWLDSLSRSQLRFYNGLIDVQLTPPQELFPIKVVGTASISAGATAVAYADPGFTWAGTGWAMIDGTNIFRFYNLLRSGLNDTHVLDDNSGATSRPNLEFSGNNLLIRNNEVTTQICTWSLIINRIS